MSVRIVESENKWIEFGLDSMDGCVYSTKRVNEGKTSFTWGFMG